MRLIYLLFPLILFSCRPDTSDPEIKSLYDDVMYVHDEIMPEMTTIHKLKKEIRKLDSQDSLAMVLLTDLDNADEGMMSWMADFGEFKKLDDAPKEDRLDYLNNELTKITKVSDDMQSAIARAQEYLKNN